MSSKEMQDLGPNPWAANAICSLFSVDTSLVIVMLPKTSKMKYVSSNYCMECNAPQLRLEDGPRTENESLSSHYDNPGRPLKNITMIRKFDHKWTNMRITGGVSRANS